MRHEEKLALLSEIDEKIIDRNTKKRNDLWYKTLHTSRKAARGKNMAIVLLSAALTLTLLMFGGLLILHVSEDPVLPPISTDTSVPEDSSVSTDAFTSENQSTPDESMAPDEPPVPTEGIYSIERTSLIGDTAVYTITYGNGTVATLDITDQSPDGSGAGIADVTFDENNNIYLSLATGKLLNMGQAVGQALETPTLRQNYGFMTLSVNNVTSLANSEDTVAVSGVSVDEDENMSYHLNNGKHLALGKVHEKGEGDEDGSMSMACINESGELVLGFASGETVNLGRVVGRDGKDGVGIAGINLSPEGDLSVTLTNGTVLNLGNIKGIGIAESKINDAGELVLTYTDGNSVNLGRVVGEKGEDGVGIASININDAGELTIILTDGTSLNLGVIKGQDGKSAYELYKEKYGYEGTEEEWLFDLVNGNLATKIKYPVTFDSAGGSEVPTQEIEEGGKVMEPEPPTRAGYTFLGWYYGEELWSFAGYSVTEAITLTAKWETVTYPVTCHPVWLNYLDESTTMPTSYTIEDTLRIPDLTLDGFVGWKYEGQDIPQKGMVFPAGSIAQNIDLQPIVEQPITFDILPVDTGAWLSDFDVWGYSTLITQEPDANVYAVADGTILAIEESRDLSSAYGRGAVFSQLLLGVNDNSTIIYYNFLSGDLPEHIYVGAEVSKGDVIGQVMGGWERDRYATFEEFEKAFESGSSDGYWYLWDYGCLVSVFTDFSSPLPEKLFTTNSQQPEILAGLFIRDYDAVNVGLWAYLTPEAAQQLSAGTADEILGRSDWQLP